MAAEIQELGPAGEPGGQPEGSGSACLVAAGVGVAAIGALTFASAVSEPVSQALRFIPPLGPYSGKAMLGYLVWLISWAVLGVSFRRKHWPLASAYWVAIPLILLGALLVFPPFVELFSAE
ncbi:MAG: hypothetical protein HYY08_01565 [Firmicutes bacterium]|nr:hypothetical protein [Bacillota bacterium]